MIRRMETEDMCTQMEQYMMENGKKINNLVMVKKVGQMVHNILVSM
jgi:hypothetical protein